MRHLLFICLLLFCVACEENESVDPTIMPEATTTGANTFGCLVDGWVYTSGRWGMPSAEYLEREEVYTSENNSWLFEDAFCGIFGAGRGFQRDGFGAGRSRFVYPFYDCRSQGGRNASLCESLF